MAKDFRSVGIVLVHGKAADPGGTCLLVPGPGGHWLEKLKGKLRNKLRTCTSVY